MENNNNAKNHDQWDKDQEDQNDQRDQCPQYLWVPNAWETIVRIKSKNAVLKLILNALKPSETARESAKTMPIQETVWTNAWANQEMQTLRLLSNVA